MSSRTGPVVTVNGQTTPAGAVIGPGYVDCQGPYAPSAAEKSLRTVERETDKARRQLAEVEQRADKARAAAREARLAVESAERKLREAEGKRRA
jgi:hypothetical protein